MHKLYLVPAILLVGLLFYRAYMDLASAITQRNATNSASGSTDTQKQQALANVRQKYLGLGVVGMGLLGLGLYLYGDYSKGDFAY